MKYHFLSNQKVMKNVAHVVCGILLSHKKEWDPDIWFKVDDHGRFDAKWSKSDWKTSMSPLNIYWMSVLYSRNCKTEKIIAGRAAVDTRDSMGAIGWKGSGDQGENKTNLVDIKMKIVCWW